MRCRVKTRRHMTWLDIAIALTFGAILALVSLIGAFAWAHDDAQWIMNNPETRSCCGPADCGVIDERNVTRTATGWRVVYLGAVYDIEDEKAYYSTDHQFWACHIYAREMRKNNERFCFFPPRSGA